MSEIQPQFIPPPTPIPLAGIFKGIVVISLIGGLVAVTIGAYVLTRRS